MLGYGLPGTPAAALSLGPPLVSPEAGDSLLCQAGWLAVEVGWARAHDHPLRCLCYVPGPGGMLTLNGLIIVGGRTG